MEQRVTTEQVYIERSGAGPDLVLLHGWGLNGGVWPQALCDTLSEHFRLHRVDLPGFGHSRDCLPDEYTLQSLVELLLPQLPERACWLGWSLGGMVAMQAALSYPERVSRLITVASSPCFVTGDDEAHWPAMPVANLEKFSAGLLADPAQILSRFIALQAMGSPDAKLQTRSLRQVVLSRPEPAEAALAGGLSILADADLRPALGQLTQPWLRLYGRLDALVPRRHQAAMDMLHPTSVSHCFPRAGHAPFLSHPEAFVGQVQRFFAA